MKFLFVLSEYLPDSGGGIISFYSHLLPKLAMAGHEVHVLVARRDSVDRPSANIDGVKVQYLTSHHLTVHDRQFERYDYGFEILRSFLPVAWAAFSQAAGGQEYDLIEVTDWQLLFAPWIVSDSPPVNLAMHSSVGQMELWDRGLLSGPYTDLVRLIEIEGVRQADFVQTNSRTNSRFWEQLSGRSVPWIPPLIEIPSRFQALQPQGDEWSGLVVGRLQELKGPELVCQALSKTKAPVTIEWIGADTAGSHGASMASYLRAKYPNIVGKTLKLLGPMENTEVLSRMRLAAFACIPSRWDVFNMTAAEAVVAGTPLICSDAAGAELLLDSPGSGFRFPSGDAGALAGYMDAAVKLSPEQRETMVQTARLGLSELLGSRQVIKQREDAYLKMSGAYQKRSTNDWLASAISPGGCLANKTRLLAKFTARELLKETASRFLRRIGMERKAND